jgi:two-component system OmpR family response regulator
MSKETTSKHILVVDDEPQIRTLVKRILATGGYRVSEAQSGAEMRKAMRAGGVDLVILDIMLPGEGGLDLLRELRATSAVPVILLTALGEPVDRVVGLELGADDYVPKPFEPREILARVRNIFRRTETPEPPPATGEDEAEAIRFAGWTLHLPSRSLSTPTGEPVRLTTAEFELLHALAAQPNRVLSRDQLLDRARHRAGTPFDRSIDVHIGHLRRKIEDNPREPRIIKTIHGVGYMLAAAERS